MARTDENAARTSLVHVRFNGRSFDVPLGDLDVNGASGDLAVKSALARYLDVSAQIWRMNHAVPAWFIRQIWAV